MIMTRNVRRGVFNNVGCFGCFGCYVCVCVCACGQVSVCT